MRLEGGSDGDMIANELAERVNERMDETNETVLCVRESGLPLIISIFRLHCCSSPFYGKEARYLVVESNSTRVQPQQETVDVAFDDALKVLQKKAISICSRNAALD